MQYAMKMAIYFVVQHLTCPVTGLVLSHIWAVVKKYVILIKADIKRRFCGCLKRKRKELRPQVIEVDEAHAHGHGHGQAKGGAKAPFKCRFDGRFTLKGDFKWRLLYLLATAGSLGYLLYENYERVVGRPDWRVSFVLLERKVLDERLPYR
jgi:hypothetical protein